MPADSSEHCFAYTGKYLVTRADAELRLLDTEGKPAFKFAPNLDGFRSKDDFWHCFSTQQGKELWLVNAEQKRIAKFQLPE